ncbi:MAG: MoaD/ThiS family protein [Candidatus Thermoplasmatota archaeon]|nr:MoaD/ThiS family protein [Candidatus Thermoplasmatota archaeon]
MKVRYFATLRDLSGVEEEEYIVRGTQSVEKVFSDLKNRHPAMSGQKSVLFALNEKFADPKTMVSNDDVLAIFPPVSGG